MTDLSSIAMSSLIAYKTALDVVGNNIGNANTEGYSKQTTTLATKNAIFSGAGYIGSGVTVSEINRLTDQYTTAIMNDNFSDFNQYDAFYRRAVSLDTYLSSEGTNIPKTTQELFKALAQAIETPAALPPRTAFMEKANFTTEQFRNMQSMIEETQLTLSEEVSSITTEMSTLAQGIASINNKVQGARAPSPELLDERDRLVAKLATYVKVNTVTQSDGGMNVSIGRGVPLVVGAHAATMSNSRNETTGSVQLSIAIAGVKQVVEGATLGGQLEGLIRFEEDVLQQASRELGLLAIGFAEKFNHQQHLGLDYNSKLGQNLFTDFNATNLQSVRAVAGNSNSSNAELHIQLDDVSQLQPTNYSLQMTTPTTGVLKRLSDDTTYTLTFGGALPQSITAVDGVAATSVDGFEINIPATSALLQANDKFTIMPTKSMARSLNMVTNDPKLLALAAPIRTTPASGNAGSGTIAFGSITSTENIDVPDLKDQFQIRILDVAPAASPTNDFQYEIINVTDGTSLGTPPGPPLLYGKLGEEITVRDDVADQGYTVILEGDLKVGDIFNAEFNTNGIGDNTNGLLLAQLEEEQFFNNNSESFADSLSNLVGHIASKTYQADVRRQVSETLFQQAEAQRLSTVGVNLDEEAANLVSLQQAYQASGQVLAVSKQMMDIIFSLLAR